ncbi:MAG TPA: POTRA domain-containing protein [Bryobacteraceae bacterium]|nr:POTRA domain-containing protein [Bryobacteraceae bacterium]
MNKTGLLLPIVVVLCAYATPPDSPEALYKTAVRHEKRGNLEEARINLLWLANYYSESPLATRARDEIGAIHLFEDGQARVRDGRYGSATVTFRTVAQVYPESPLAKQAEAASRSAERKEEQTGGPLVRSLTFRNTAPATSREILDRFKENEVGLAVEQPYRQEDIDQACRAIAELLAEKGMANVDVRAEIHAVSSNRVKIEFIVR